MEGQEVIACQTDNNQSKAEKVALEERIEGIADQAEKEKKMKKGKDIVEHHEKTVIFYSTLLCFAAIVFSGGGKRG